MTTILSFRLQFLSLKNNYWRSDYKYETMLMNANKVYQM